MTARRKDPGQSPGRSLEEPGGSTGQPLRTALVARPPGFWTQFPSVLALAPPTGLLHLLSCTLHQKVRIKIVQLVGRVK